MCIKLLTYETHQQGIDIDKKKKSKMATFLTLTICNPHDALNHHIASLNIDLIKKTLERFYKEIFHGFVSIITKYIIHFPPTSSHLYPLQVENGDSNSRLVMDGDDNGKFKVSNKKHVESVGHGTQQRHATD